MENIFWHGSLSSFLSVNSACVLILRELTGMCKVLGVLIWEIVDKEIKELSLTYRDILLRYFPFGQWLDYP